MTKTPTQYFTSPSGQVSFPTLVEPKAYQNLGKKKFSADVFIPTESFLKSGIGEAIEALAAGEKWKSYESPFKTNDEIEKRPPQIEGQDVVLLKANTGEEYPPAIVGVNGEKIDPAIIKGGDIIRIRFSLKPVSVSGRKFVKAYLSAVQYIRPARPEESFSGGKATEFDEYSVDDDPFAVPF